MTSSPPNRILIVRLSAIGDVVHTLPCLHALREAFPKARIGWLVEELSASLLRDHPELDELFVIPKKRWRVHPFRPSILREKWAFYSRLRNERWDVAIDLQGLTKSAWPMWLSGATRRIGFAGVDAREISLLFSNERVLPDPARPHVVERNLSLLAPLGISEPRIEWRFPDFTAEREKIASFFESISLGPQKRYVAFYPGAGWETKRWPPDSYADLAKRIVERAVCDVSLDLPIVLIWGGTGEESLCREIQRQAGLDEKRLIMAPPTGLRDLAALLERAAVVVGGDTGPVHLAEALGVPVVGIYGGSDPVRNGPWGEKHRVLQSDSSLCVGCWRTKCDHTPRLDCLKTISSEAVCQAIVQILSKIE